LGKSICSGKSFGKITIPKTSQIEIPFSNQLKIPVVFQQYKTPFALSANARARGNSSNWKSSSFKSNANESFWLKARFLFCWLQQFAHIAQRANRMRVVFLFSTHDQLIKRADRIKFNPCFIRG